MNESDAQLKLCYVDVPWAFFTDQPIDKQWGDDWDDAPYQHNAGNPYTHDGQRVIRVAFEADLDTPHEWELNGPYSVQDINKGVVPWLVTSRYSTKNDIIKIFAGCTLAEFVREIRRAGGKAYLEYDEPLPENPSK